MRISTKFLTLGGLAVCAMGMLFVAVQPAAANSAFAKASAMPCSACHEPGRETDAPNSGFTANGQTVYSAFTGSCNYHMDCAISAAFGNSPSPTPSYNAQPNFNSQRNFNSQPNYNSQPSYSGGGYRTNLVKFTDGCIVGGSYFTVLPGGNQPPLRFKLENGHKVHIELPPGATFATSCGGWPAANAQFMSAN